LPLLLLQTYLHCLLKLRLLLETLLLPPLKPLKLLETLLPELPKLLPPQRQLLRRGD
jgi:hypothetical protein